MRPFNYGQAKSGKPVCTRSGRPVRIMCWDAKRGDHPIQALILEDNGLESRMGYALNGSAENSCAKESKNDLMMVGDKEEGWINIYRDQIDENGEYNTPMGYACGEIYASKEEAEQKEGMAYKDALIATIKIEWEE